MIAYFCYRSSDNNVDLSDLYADLSVIYVNFSGHYVDLSVIYVNLSDHYIVRLTCQKKSSQIVAIHILFL